MNLAPFAIAVCLIPVDGGGDYLCYPGDRVLFDCDYMDGIVLPVVCFLCTVCCGKNVMSIYTQIKKAVSMKEAVKHYGLSVTRNGMARCPFHEDHSPCLKLNEDYYYCFGCHANGDVIDFVANRFQLFNHHAAEKLAMDF